MINKETNFILLAVYLPNYDSHNVHRWMDEKNCHNFIKPWYRNALTFPFNWYYPNAYEKEAKHKIYTLYNHLDSDTDIMTEVK